MKKQKRIFLIVLDSFGAGAMEDAGEYGDENADTMGHIAEAVPGLFLPNLRKLGLANLKPLSGMEPVKEPLAYFTTLKEQSRGKDTMTGHWEMMGIRTQKPFVTFTETGFPPELIRELMREHEVILSMPFVGHEDDFKNMGTRLSTLGKKIKDQPNFELSEELTECLNEMALENEN